MPLTNNVQSNVRELVNDNKKSGKARGNKGKVRKMDQILAIAYSAAKRKKMMKGGLVSMPKTCKYA